MRHVPSTLSQIYEFFYDTELTDKVYTQVLNTQFNWKTYQHLPNETKLSDNNKQNSFYNEHLFGWVENCINKVGSLHFPSLSFSICDSWVSKTEFNEKLRKHKHFNSIFSAVFYCDNNNTPINFFIPDPIASQYKMLLSSTTFNEHVISIKPEKGKLIVFDSQLQHNVSKHLEKEIRYSVVFNSFFNGKLNLKTNGIAEDTDHLHIEVKYCNRNS